MVRLTKVQKHNMRKNMALEDYVEFPVLSLGRQLSTPVNSKHRLKYSRNVMNNKQFYRARKPTPRELATKDDSNQVLLVDEVKQASTTKMRIVVTWVPAGHRKDFRKHMDVFDSRLKKRGEVKYSNTTPAERLAFYESVMEQDFEVYDTVELEIPYDVVEAVGFRQGHPIPYWESRYIYQVEAALHEAMSNHAGRIDVIVDNPPFDVIEEIRQVCERAIGNGYDIRWLTIAPSRHIVELQTHDFITGLDYDVRTGQISNNSYILRMNSSQRKRYEVIVEILRSKLRGGK